MNKKYKKNMVKIFSYSRNRKFVKLQFINILNAVEQSLLNPQIKNKYRQKKICFFVNKKTRSFNVKF